MAARRREEGRDGGVGAGEGEGRGWGKRGEGPLTNFTSNSYNLSGKITVIMDKF